MRGRGWRAVPLGSGAHPPKTSQKQKQQRADVAPDAAASTLLRDCARHPGSSPASSPRARPPLECVGLRWFLLSGTGEAGPDSADYRGAVPPTSPVRTAVEGGQRRSACGPGTLTPAHPGDGPGSRRRCWRVPAGGREEQRDTAPRPRTCAAPTAVASTRRTRGAGGGTRGPEEGRAGPSGGGLPPPPPCLPRPALKRTACSKH